MMELVLIFLVKIILINKQVVNSYNVALVEYFWDYQVFPKLAPADLVNRNSKIYHEIVEKIKKTHGKLDLVVFPEATLASERPNTPEGRKGMTLVPDVGKHVIPCNSTGNYADFFKLLSCTAREYSTYLVVNLKEKTEENQVYNTNVVFDRNGKVIARYRKYHLYLEPNTDRPASQLVTFDTDFGKRFGIFTCFDIIYESPAIELVRKGVENFIFPTLWVPELPYLTTIQIQQMWAQGNDVNLLTSCATSTLYGSGGAGIFLGNKGVLAKDVSIRTYNTYLYKEVKLEKKYFDPCCKLEINDTIAEEMDKYALYIEDLSAYSYKILDTKTSRNIDETLCQEHGIEKLCCNFKINTTVSEHSENSMVYNYFLVTRSGVRTFGMGTYKTGVENCGLIACPGTSITDCGKRFPTYNAISWPLTFDKIEISASFARSDKKIQFPNSLLADFSPISPSCTTWKTETYNSTIRRTFSTNVAVTKLLTFAIFGRNFNLDVI